MPKKRPKWTRGGLKGRLTGVQKNIQGVMDSKELLSETEYSELVYAYDHIDTILSDWSDKR